MVCHVTVLQNVHWSELIAGEKDEGEGTALQDSERKRREAVWELFKSELVFFLDHLMVIKHVCTHLSLVVRQYTGDILYAYTRRYSLTFDVS